MLVGMLCHACSRSQLQMVTLGPPTREQAGWSCGLHPHAWPADYVDNQRSKPPLSVEFAQAAFVASGLRLVAFGLAAAICSRAATSAWMQCARQPACRREYSCARGLWSRRTAF